MINVPGLSRRCPEPEASEPSSLIEADDSGLLREAPAEERFKAMRRPRHRVRSRIFNGRTPEPLPSHRGPVEPPRDGKRGICCSGGGIRSAAFSLGALQVLQERGELERASYLAAVSGGSYMATAFSLLRKTGGPDDSDPTLFGPDKPKPFAPGSPEEQYLRNRCSYLAPSAGDKIFLGLRLVLGLLLNLAFVAIPLIALGVILAGLIYAPAFSHLAGELGELGKRCGVEGKAVRCTADIPPWAWISTLAMFGGGLACGLATLLWRWRKEQWGRFFTTWATRLLLASVAFALLFIALPYLLQWLREDHSGSAGGKGVGFGAGTLALLAGVAAQLGHFLSSSQTQEGFGRVRSLFGKLGKGARMAIAYFAAALVGPLMLLAVFAFSVEEAMKHANARGAVDWDLIWLGVVVSIGFLIAYLLVDLTTWSLHPFYKRRLSSVFALRRIRAEEALSEDGGLSDRAEIVRPTGSEDGDAGDGGIAVERDYDRTLKLSDMAAVEGEGEEWPTLLICAAANISDTNATPPGRRVTSFTFSAHAVGGPLVGAVETKAIEGAFDEQLDSAGRRKHDLSLLAATAMSGAALSPSMGKMTRRPLTFLMALANIRLGVWVPNPRWVHEFRSNRELRLHHVRPRPYYLLCELFGLNRVGSKYLYVTDGGHYENLGLVELLRRGCTEIYCLDASGVGAGGVEFEALGEALTLARSELGVEIKFDGEEAEAEDAKETEDTSPAAMVPDEKTHFAKRDVVTAEIKYDSGEKGKLVYVRNTMTETAPWDVRAHHEEDPRFPNNPTIDQLYTDQKFEAYRALGSRAAVRAVKVMGVGDGTVER